MNNRNYQRELDRLIQRNEEKGLKPTLLLHSCCAPCSSYVLEYLSQYFRITVFFYNPNIYPPEEYEFRVDEIKRLMREMPLSSPVEFIEGVYEPQRFYALAKGHEHEAEGGERCTICFNLRLGETAKLARERGFDYFTTTLSISPRKKSIKLNEVGDALARQFEVPFLPSDFKRKDGYQRSIDLSYLYHLYRQNYCGCVFSKRDAQGEEQG